MFSKFMKGLRGRSLKKEEKPEQSETQQLPKCDSNFSEPDSENRDIIEISGAPATIIIIGCGSRGNVIADYAKLNPGMMKVVAVCDIVDFKCQQIAEKCDIAPDKIIVGGWEKLAKLPKFADAVAICTTDRDHVEPAIDLKYHILCEKPMSVNLEECVMIYEAIQRNAVLFAVGHVLRYTMGARCLKRILQAGTIGDIINIQHVEMIGYWHFAHSYVRGNWHKESTSSFSLLTKCCHDIDLITYLMEKKCTSISYFGGLHHFRKEKKPKEAGNAKKCLKCPIKDSCVYSAKKIYIDRFNDGFEGWPVNVVQPKIPIDIENLTEALNSSDYGKCVYELDNDVADHQVVNMSFEGGSTASHTMVAFTNGLTRKTRIFGSLGELEWNDMNKIWVTDFATGKRVVRDPLFERDDSGPIQWSGHAGGDFALLRAFATAVKTGDAQHILSGPMESLETHMYVFAAEESRLTQNTVDMDLFKQKIFSRVDTKG